MATATAAEGAAAASGVSDPLCGLVRSCLELPVEADDPRVFCFVSQAADTSRWDPAAPRVSTYGCGAGLTREAAAGAAVGEIVEGYTAAMHDPASIVHASWEELDEDAVRPEAFALFAPEQYAAFRDAPRPGIPRYEPFTPRTRTGWVHGWSLSRRRPVLVPAPFVFLPYRYAAGEPYLVDGLSTGLACAATRDEAVLRALCEVVERDALSILWHNRLVPRRIAHDGDDRLGRHFRERFACRGARYHLLDATLDVAIPTVIAVFVDERGGAAVGSATRPDAFGAAAKALLEAAQCRVAWKRDLVRGAGRRYAADFSDVMDFGDHARLYTDREMRRHLELLWSAPGAIGIGDLPSVAGDSPADVLARCVALLDAAGLEPIAVDLTSDDVREAGYHVVRVVVPGMEMLNARHGAPFRGGRRMAGVPRRLELHPAADADRSAPHPFP